MSIFDLDVTGIEVGGFDATVFGYSEAVDNEGECEYEDGD